MLLMQMDVQKIVLKFVPGLLNAYCLVGVGILHFGVLHRHMAFYFEVLELDQLVLHPMKLFLEGNHLWNDS